MAEPEDVEILVHIAAPSRAADDAHYRSLASAYLHFQPQRRLTLDLPTASSDGTQDQAGRRELEASHDADAVDDATTSSPVIFRSSASPLTSLGDALNNPASTRDPRPMVPAPVAARRRRSQQGATSQGSWQSLPSTVYDSIPENDVTAAIFTTPTRVLENYLQQFGSHAGTPHSPSQSEDGQRATEHPAARPIAVTNTPLAVTREQSASTIPCTPGNKPPLASSVELGGARPGSATVGGIINARLHDPEALLLRDDIIEESIIHVSDTPSGNRAKSEPPPRKQQRTGQSQDGRQMVGGTSSDIGIQHTPQEVERSITFLPDHGYTYDSLELHAPEPPAADARLSLTDLITPAIAQLASDANLEKRYRPEKQTRDLRPFERGHWSVACSGWSQELKRQMWAWLANYIGMQQAGWGVWCKRDEAFSRVKVFCWGGLAGHMYLILWLASRREILYTEAYWIDGEGLPVVIMPQRTMA